MGKKHRNKRGGRANNSNTRIHVKFNAVIEPVWTPDTGTGGGGFQSIPINVALTELTRELGTIYKLYRYVDISLHFQADPNPSTTIVSGKPTYIAMNYIPAKEQPITVWPNPLDLEKFEGPAVGFFGSARGAPYHYHVPKPILLSMPYNWYETKQNSPQFSDFTQGQLFLKTTDANYFSPIFINLVVEFQTMEDPEFLTSRMNINKPIQSKYVSKKITNTEPMEIEECDQYSRSGSNNSVFVGRSMGEKNYSVVQRL